jgi:hypothetical protein
MKAQKLYFLRDNSSAKGNQVYSGHNGTGKRFSITMSDYGKYAMKPSGKKTCEDLIRTIEKAAKGRNNQPINFKWEIVPMTQIDLCNFYEDTSWNQEAYDKLKKEQSKLQ